MANLMRLPDGPGWSPDGGRYWVRGDLCFWADGEVWDMRDGGLARTMPGGYVHEEDYSDPALRAKNGWPPAPRPDGQFRTPIEGL